MIRLTCLAVIAFALSPSLSGGEAPLKSNSLLDDSLLDALEWVESGGRGAETPDGDGGAAIGPFQIHRAYWIDGCRFLEVAWPYSDAKNPVKARMVVRAYLGGYGRHYKLTTAFALARLHNGGPSGWKKQATVGYAKRVMARMKGQQQ